MLILKKSKIFDLIIKVTKTFTIIVSFAYLILAIQIGLTRFGVDALIRYMETFYTFRGINPLIEASNEFNDLYFSNRFKIAMGNFPWVYIINIFFMPPLFSSWNNASLFVFLIYLLYTFLASILMVIFLKSILPAKLKTNFNMAIVFLIPFGNYFFLSGISNGNHSIIVSAIITILFVLYHIIKKKETLYFLLPILVVFSLIKPQISLPFLIVFYFHLIKNKEIKFVIVSLIYSSILLILFTTIASLLLVENPFLLILSMFQRGINYYSDGFNFLNYGILDFLVLWNFPTLVPLILQALIIIPLFVFIGLKNISLFSKFSLVSTFILIWTYNHVFDGQLILFSTLYLYIFMNKGYFKLINASYFLLYTSLFFFLFNLLPIRQSYYSLSPILIPLLHRIFLLLQFIFIYYIELFVSKFNLKVVK